MKTLAKDILEGFKFLWYYKYF